jgi:large subunit ribosomal protein L14
MIKVQTVLKIIDNSGAKKIMCIKILGSNKKYGKLGDLFIGSVKRALPNLPIKHKSVVRALIVRTKKSIKRSDGICIKFEDNAAVILGSDNNPKGTRIFGPLPLELRNLNFTKVVSLAAEII